jgi:hypothetical protein
VVLTRRLPMGEREVRKPFFYPLFNLLFVTEFEN